MKKLLALALALTLTLSLAACSGKKDDTSLADVKAKGKIVMLTNATFPPFEYLGADGKTAGVDADVAAKIAQELGVDLEIVDMNFDLLISSLDAGKGDFVAAGMTINPERAAQVDFSAEYVKSAQYAIVKKDSTLTTKTLNGLVFAVQESTTGDFYATDELAPKEVLRFKNATETGSALTAGKCDAIVIDKLPAEAIVANSGGALMLLPEPLTEESYAFAVKKGSATLLEAINASLKKMMDAGEIDALVSKHMLAA